jgi:hypothetical protein
MFLWRRYFVRNALCNRVRLPQHALIINAQRPATRLNGKNPDYKLHFISHCNTRVNLRFASSISLYLIGFFGTDAIDEQPHFWRNGRSCTERSPDTPLLNFRSHRRLLFFAQQRSSAIITFALNGSFTVNFALRQNKRRDSQTRSNANKIAKSSSNELNIS